MAGTWDPIYVKNQLRLTTQRLGQLQDRKDSLAYITSKDIATLLRQRNVPLARAKAQNLMKEEAISNALEVLEMHCGVILERFTELEKSELKLHPTVVEAMSSIIYAAPHTESKDLNIVRDMLTLRLGPDFTRSAAKNSDGHVSPRIIRSLHSNPSASEVDEYLHRIGHSFGVEWKTQMRSEEKIIALSEMLDSSDIMGSIDVLKLRSISSSGIPNNPPWLRPRVWKLLLGSTPIAKAQWELEARKKRESYYDLIRRLLVHIPTQTLPSSPLSLPDSSLLSLVDALARVPAHLYGGLEDEPELFNSCPLNDSALQNAKIICASALDMRIQLIQDSTSEEEVKDTSFGTTPEIRLDFGSAPSSPQNDAFDQPRQPQRTLSSSITLAPKVFRNIAAHHNHVSALLRLLFVHKSLNPGTHSPQIASLLVPLYVVLNQEIEPDEVAHAEADTFWLFEALLREISELEEEEGGVIWMKKFGERLSTVDADLHEDLKLKGLDPSLPQYSYRWLSPLLAHTLPFPSVLVVWDAVFSQPDASRQSNPKLEHLLDICTAMLVRARPRLLLLGKAGRKSPSLWNEDASSLSRSPLRSWELGEAFMEGMTLLQQYPIEEAGGIGRILQVADDILVQREESAKPPVESVGFGAKIRETVWRGFTNQVSSTANSPEDSEEDEEEEEEETENEGSHTETSGSILSSVSTGSGWASRLRTTVVRGITNQSVMDGPPSPNSSSPSPSRTPSRDPSPAPPSGPPPAIEKETSSSHLSPPTSSSGLWGYAARLKQSDVAATLSKVSTNFSAKALDVWSANARSAPPSEVPTFDKQRDISTAGTPIRRILSEQAREGNRRGSVPNIDRSEVYSPPPRPAFFKQPRDTRIFSPEEMASLVMPDSPESVTSAQSAPTPVRTSHVRAESMARLSSLPPWSSLHPAAPKASKAGPRPLMLNPTSLVTATPANQVTRSANTTPTPHQGQWTDILRSKVQSSNHKASQSSISSMQTESLTSPKTAKSGWDSDTSASRVVPLNRASVSPMAPAFRGSRSYARNESISSQSDRESGSRGQRTPSETLPRDSLARSSETDSRYTRGWEQVPVPDSPSTLPSSPPPRTPVTSTGLVQTSIRVSAPERQRGSVVLSESGVMVFDPPPHVKKAPRKSPSPATLEPVEDTSDSSIPPISPLTKVVPRIRTKRYGPQARLSSLRLRDTTTQAGAMEQPSLSPNSLAAPEMDSDFDLATTPRAVSFPSTSPTDGRSPRRSRKISMESHERRPRKISADTGTVRPRKVSADSYHRRTESAADEGDDEGYDELLSAYESEEGSKDGHAYYSEA